MVAVLLVLLLLLLTNRSTGQQMTAHSLGTTILMRENQDETENNIIGRGYRVCTR